MKHLAALLLVATAFITSAAAQTPDWREITTASSPSAGIDHVMAYDSARQKVVLFGGINYPNYFNDTWEYDGVNWTQVTTASSPSAGINHAMVYDSARQKVVLFGGFVSGVGNLNDTWEYDGVNWTEITTTSSPSARDAPAMVYDSVRGKVVLFGGYASGVGFVNDTWEYDGVNWTQVTTASSPSARENHEMAYDSVRGKVVMFGGDHYPIYLNDTWEYDGVNWTQVTTASSPSARWSHKMAYDRARGKVVLFGGLYPNQFNDTWEYDGVNWTEVTPASSMSTRHRHAMAYDSARGKVVMFGGTVNGVGYVNDTWEYGLNVDPPAADWAEITTASSPSARRAHTMAYDSARQKVVLFGGNGGSSVGVVNDTWEYDGANWTLVTTASSPSARQLHGMVYDSGRGKVVLFGGDGGSSATSENDTWEYDGVNWTLVTTASSPSARGKHTMAYDSARGKVVMFGGFGGISIGSLNDTWEYDGVNWTEVTTTSIPIARQGQAMTYDSVRGKVVMFGGFASGIINALNDTWEYDGVNWTQITTANPPSARDGHTMAYDSVRGKVVMFGGYRSYNYFNDTREYDGVNWTLVPTVSPPSTRDEHAMAYDSVRQKVVVFGGSHGGDETWEYGCGSLALIGGLDPAVLGTANFSMTSGDTLEFNYGHCVPGSFVVLTLNINEPVATTVEIPGFAQAWAGSTPTGNMATGFSTILPAPNTQVAVPAGIFAIGDTCRWQAVYLDFVSAPWLVIASNVIETTYN